LIGAGRGFLAGLRLLMEPVFKRVNQE
jgi:hypothetical protein